MNSQNLRLAGLLGITLAFLFLLTGCHSELPTGNPSQVMLKFCREYNIEIKSILVGTTLWVYMPTDELLNESLQFIPGVEKKLRLVFANINRVVLNSKVPIDFYVLVVSDIKKMGVDLVYIGYVRDILWWNVEKFPYSEYRQRMVNSNRLAPEALGDKEGKHLMPFDVSLPKFLMEQIRQRLFMRLTQGEYQSYFKVNLIQIDIEKGIIHLLLDVETVKSLPMGKEINLLEEAVKMAAHVINGYRFDDFIMLEVNSLKDKSRRSYSRAIIKEMGEPFMYEYREKKTRENNEPR